ncbi:MAG: hypothetical protein LBT59_26675 [Clostridiales bacterium]|nr:hypothetical protein [Clostridiales bacterium]
MLDSEECWEECKPVPYECPVCGTSLHSLAVGFVYRASRDVKWVYIGSRCEKCHRLDSYLDWKIDYSPTDEMENNV